MDRVGHGILPALPIAAEGDDLTVLHLVATARTTALPRSHLTDTAPVRRGRHLATLMQARLGHLAPRGAGVPPPALPLPTRGRPPGQRLTLVVPLVRVQVHGHARHEGLRPRILHAHGLRLLLHQPVDVGLRPIPLVTGQTRQRPTALLVQHTRLSLQERTTVVRERVTRFSHQGARQGAGPLHGLAPLTRRTARLPPAALQPPHDRSVRVNARSRGATVAHQSVPHHTPRAHRSTHRRRLASTLHRARGVRSDSSGSGRSTHGSSVVTIVEAPERELTPQAQVLAALILHGSIHVHRVHTRRHGAIILCPAPCSSGTRVRQEFPSSLPPPRPEPPEVLPHEATPAERRRRHAQLLRGVPALAEPLQPTPQLAAVCRPTTLTLVARDARLQQKGRRGKGPRLGLPRLRRTRLAPLVPAQLGELLADVRRLLPEALRVPTRGPLHGVRLQRRHGLPRPRGPEAQALHQAAHHGVPPGTHAPPHVLGHQAVILVVEQRHEPRGQRAAEEPHEEVRVQRAPLLRLHGPEEGGEVPDDTRAPRGHHAIRVDPSPQPPRAPPLRGQHPEEVLEEELDHDVEHQPLAHGVRRHEVQHGGDALPILLTESVILAQQAEAAQGLAPMDQHQQGIAGVGHVRRGPHERHAEEGTVGGADVSEVDAVPVAPQHAPRRQMEVPEGLAHTGLRPSVPQHVAHPTLLAHALHGLGDVGTLELLQLRAVPLRPPRLYVGPRSLDVLQATPDVKADEEVVPEPPPPAHRGRGIPPHGLARQVLRIHTRGPIHIHGTARLLAGTRPPVTPRRPHGTRTLVQRTQPRQPLGSVRKERREALLHHGPHALAARVRVPRGEPQLATQHHQARV